MSRKPSITIVGPGSLGSSLALALKRAGYRIQEVVYRSDKKRAQQVARRCGAKAVSFDQARFDADVLWICVGDREIEQTASVMASRASLRGKTVFHASGALSSDELKPLKLEGASVAAVHPMMSFVRKGDSELQGVSFALEGEGTAVRCASEIAIALGGTSFKLSKKDKPLYHALGAFSSPLIVAQLATAERIGRALGLKPEGTRKVIAPILRKTVDNYIEGGPAAAFSGPILRGDVETIRRNLNALQRIRGAAGIYRALATVAAEDLPVKDRGAVTKLLGRPK